MANGTRTAHCRNKAKEKQEVPMIHVENLNFTYPESTTSVIHDMSFDVHDGEVFGFLGPSGAGKSTTQNILIGLLKGFAGTIEVMNRSLASWGSELYQHIGVSFELPNHYLKLTARENLNYFSELYGGRGESIESVLKLVDLHEVMDKPVATFSKGMKNRLNLARSLLHQPKLWFLDEPTSGLDPVNAVRVRNLVQSKQSQGVTTFITTHSMHTADEICDRVAFVVDGRIAAIDSPQQLKHKYGRREVEVTWDASKEELRPSRYPLDGLSDNEQFLNDLRNRPISSIHSQETTLEDVFIQITGRSLS